MCEGCALPGCSARRYVALDAARTTARVEPAASVADLELGHLLLPAAPIRDGQLPALRVLHLHGLEKPRGTVGLREPLKPLTLLFV